MTVIEIFYAWLMIAAILLAALLVLYDDPASADNRFTWMAVMAASWPLLLIALLIAGLVFLFSNALAMGRRGGR